MSLLPIALAALSAALAAEERFDSLILRQAQSRGVCPRLVKAIITVESGFKPAAVSPAGARGLMQLMPDTARLMGVAPESLAEPEENIRAGIAYLLTLCASLRRVHGLGGACRGAGPDWGLRRVLASYHAGPRAMLGRAWHHTTREYVRAVMAAYRSERSVLRPALVASREPPEGA